MDESPAQTAPPARRGGRFSRYVLIAAGTILVLSLSSVLFVHAFPLDKHRSLNCKAFIDQLSIAVEQYRMRYRRYPPIGGPLVTNENKRSLHADTTRNLHFYLGTPGAEPERVTNNGVWSYRIHPPLFDFRDDHLEGGGASDLVKACASKKDVQSILHLADDPAVRAAVRPLIDPWGNRIWYAIGSFGSYGSCLPGKRDLRGSIFIESMGPPDPDGGFSWFDPEHPERYPDNDVVNWRKP